MGDSEQARKGQDAGRESTERVQEEAEKIQKALRRIQGIADADGGRMLGDYGFRTIKDALADASMALGRLMND